MLVTMAIRKQAKYSHLPCGMADEQTTHFDIYERDKGQEEEDHIWIYTRANFLFVHMYE